MFEMPTIFLVANFDSVYEIVSGTKQRISWNLEYIFLNNHLQLRDCLEFPQIDFFPIII